LNGAKIAKDGGLQIKILSAVSSAGGSSKADPVTQAAKGLQSNIHQYVTLLTCCSFLTRSFFFCRILNVVSGEQIRTRYKNSVQRTVAMNKAVSIWKQRK
jgi:hypothetical protein